MSIVKLVLAFAAVVAAVVNAIIALLEYLRNRRARAAAGFQPGRGEETRVTTDRKIWVPFFVAVVSTGFAALFFSLWLRIPPPPSPSVVWDFESSTQGWGEHLENELHVEGQAVDPNCNRQLPIRYTGDCSLEFNPTDTVDRDAYVTVLENAQGSRIEAYVFIPSGADISTSQGRSTAKIIVWDRNWASYESDYVELIRGRWQEISWDLRENEWPGPWREFGLHFWFITDYRGPIYIDKVTLTK